MSIHPRTKDPWGLIQIFTGDGKGKTSAALGTILRAAGVGKKIGLIYFDKGGEHYSERKLLQERFPEVVFAATGRDRIDEQTKRFDFAVTDEDRAEAARGWKIASDWISSEKYDLIVLDELNTVLGLGMLGTGEVISALRDKPRSVEIICTGRKAPLELIDLADLVTDMKLVKHYFYGGVSAREGLDY